MFYLSGVGLAVFLNVLLLSKQKKTPGDWVLSAWLFVIMLHLLLFTLFRVRLYPQLLGIELPLPLMHGPLLYIYTLALCRNRVSMKSWLIHLALPLAFYIYLIPFFLLPTDQKLFIYENRGIGYETFMLIRNFCIPFSGLLYVVLASVVLRRHRKTIVENFSSIEKINLLWLQYLIIWIGAIWLLVIAGNDDWIFGATVVFIFFIGYFGIRQVGIFSTAHHKPVENHENQYIIELELKDENATETLTKTKYQKSGLSVELADQIHQQLTLTMQSNKAYRDSELSLATLAELMNTQANYLSQVINEREGKNFYDYINTLRVEEFTRIAGEPGNNKLTLYAIAQECGFNSKSSFNRYFKKVTGLSPSAYLQSADLEA